MDTTHGKSLRVGCTRSVSIAQIAATTLNRLDLDPQKLQAVAAERTQLLPRI